MQNFQNGRRVGFILSTIYNGSALKLWHKIVSRASQDKGAFFVFPGGKLSSEKSNDCLRNSVYELEILPISTGSSAGLQVSADPSLWRKSKNFTAASIKFL